MILGLALTFTFFDNYSYLGSIELNFLYETYNIFYEVVF